MTKPKFESETFLPAIQNLIGVHYKKVEWERKNAKHHDDVKEQCRKMWCGIVYMGRVISSMGDCTHLNVAIGNEKRKVSEYIKTVTGCNPWFDKEHELFTWFNYTLL